MIEAPDGYLTLEQALALIDSDQEKPFSAIPLAQIIDAATDYREQIREKDKVVKAMKENFKVFEQAILQSMRDSGTPESPLLMAGGLHSSATMTISDVPTVKDWGLVEGWIYENKALHLLQKRISSKVWETTVTVEGEIPGIETFVQEKISLRKR